MRSIAKLVGEVRNLVQKGWTQDVEAVDANGAEVAVNSEEACAWDLTGAMDLVANTPSEFLSLRDVILDAISTYGVDEFITIVDFNDSPNTRREDVLAVLDRAERIAKTFDRNMAL